MAITNLVTSNQQHLELSLKDWQEYTSLTENLMVWLREKEKILRSPSKATLVHDVERELEALKVSPFEWIANHSLLQKHAMQCSELNPRHLF